MPLDRRDREVLTEVIEGQHQYPIDLKKRNHKHLTWAR